MFCRCRNTPPDGMKPPGSNVPGPMPIVMFPTASVIWLRKGVAENRSVSLACHAYLQLGRLRGEVLRQDCAHVRTGRVVRSVKGAIIAFVAKPARPQLERSATGDLPFCAQVRPVHAGELRELNSRRWKSLLQRAELQAGCE